MFKAIVPDPDDEGVILVRGVPFGGPGERDAHGQFFTFKTNFLSHILPLPPVFHFHGAKSGSLADQIGETLAREQRRDGVYYRARLFIDSNVEAVKLKAIQLWEAAKSGTLFASSGAVEATIKVSQGGEILQWLVGELSLIDTRNNRENPASFHATVVPIKSDLDGIETGDVTIEGLNISTKREHSDDDDYDDKGDYSDKPRRRRKGDYTDKRFLEDFLDDFMSEMRRFYPDEDDLRESMVTMFRRMFGTDNISSTRSADMPDELNNQDLLNQMQAQMAQMQAQMTELSTQNATLQTDIQARDGQIEELQGIVSTKSAEVAMGTHVGMVEAWIKDGKITPAEKDQMLEVLSFAYQADTTTKGDTGFVNAIKGLIEVRPVNPVLGSPSQVYTNLNGSGIVEGPGGGTDPANIARLKRYAEIPDA